MAESPTPDPVDGSGSQPPAAPAPADPRPKPQFGELAPPGWEWKPPADSHTGHQQEPMVVHKQSHAPAAPKARPEPRTRPTTDASVAAGAADASVDGVKKAPSWDRPLTVALLALGLFGVTLFVRVQEGATQSIALLYEQEGLGAYTPAASVASILFWGNVVQIALWVIAAALSISLLVRRRRAFWVPILVGALAVISLFLVLMAVLLTDPTLLDHFAKQAG